MEMIVANQSGSEMQFALFDFDDGRKLPDGDVWYRGIRIVPYWIRQGVEYGAYIWSERGLEGCHKGNDRSWESLLNEVKGYIDRCLKLHDRSTAGHAVFCCGIRYPDNDANKL